MALLEAIEVRGRAFQVVAARLGALGSVIVPAVVAVETKIGAVVVIVWSDHGLYALDIVLVLVGLALAVMLVRYVERVAGRWGRDFRVLAAVVAVLRAEGMRPG